MPLNILNPYADAIFPAPPSPPSARASFQGGWLKGNLHTHTTISDGSRPRQEVIDDYAQRGYDFLMLSDHDVVTAESDYAALASRGLILIPGNEITAHGPHLLHVHARARIEPDPLRQAVLSAVAADRGFAIVNHPNWQEKFDHCPLAKMSEWVGYVGLEIYNGVISRLDGSAYALDKWDMLLSAGRRVWGFANDDSHAPGDVALGWNVAYVTDRSTQGILDALIAGRFYASTGVVISDLRVERDTITLRADNAQRIIALQQVGKRFAAADGPELRITVPPDAKYVRFECWGQGEQFTWTQPFFIEKT
ncbi:MAG: CehA/McbA family metallohydrolase [Phycisphaeraceae bacterium]|nr:CehA/McbA family metallohydrolase [Phycisphaeraceae bacterium]